MEKYTGLADLAGSVFALGILAARDMAYLWDMIVAVAAGQGALAAGDSACGFGNTAMALADTRHIPKVWAGHDRAPQPGGLRTRGRGPGQGLRL